MFLEEKKLGPLVETKPESAELKVMRRARALIAKGWTQGANHRASWWGLRNSYCSIGAIRMAATGGPNRSHCDNSWGARNIVDNVVDRLAKAADFHPSAIVSWNDDYPSQTKAKVLAAFDRAIASLE